MYTVGANWNVLAYLHFDTLRKEFVSIQLNFSTAKSICYNKLTDRVGCRNIVSHLERRIMLLQQRNSLVFHPHRAKRATLDFIGNIASDLFGVMGPRFGETYANDMKQLAKNEEIVKALLANHTSILESTLNILKHDENELEKQAHHFDVLTAQVQSLQDLVEAEQSLNDALLYLTQIINEYERQQTAIIQVVSDSRRDLINHNVLTFQQIEKQVDTMVKQVGTKYIVPGGVDVYSLSKITPYLVGNQYVFKISIPLLRPRVYKMYRIVPVPIKSGNKFLWIETKHKKLVASADRQKFHFADDLITSECNTFREALVCEEPNLWFMADAADCVWNVFNENSLEKCEFKRSPQKNEFIETGNNGIIFVCINKIRIAVMCNDTVAHDYLVGEGVLRTQGCSIRGAGIHLDPPADMNEQRSMEVAIPEVDILQVESKLPRQENITQNLQFVRSNFSKIDLRLNETKIKLQELKRFDKTNLHDVHHYTLIYVLLSCIIVYAMVKLKQKYFTNSICQYRRPAFRCPPFMPSRRMLATASMTHNNQVNERPNACTFRLHFSVYALV